MGTRPPSPDVPPLEDTFARLFDALHEGVYVGLLGPSTSTTVAANPGLKVLVLGGGVDGFLVAQTAPNSDLAYYQGLGVEFVEAEGEGKFWWEELSWEQLGKYAADVILVDDRKADLLEIFEAQPLWSGLPAVEAGQVGRWHAFDPATYRFYIEALDELTPLLERSRIVT